MKTKKLLPLKSKFILVLILLTYCTIDAQYYWVGDAGNWSDYANHWATSSGGSTFHNTPPSKDDDVFFDANSFTKTGQLVSIDADFSECRSMDWSGVVNNPGIFSSLDLNIYGNLVLSPDMTCDLRVIEMESPNPNTIINTFGVDLGTSSILRIYDKGTFELESTLDVFSIQFLEGTFNSNNNTINCNGMFLVDFDTEKSLNMGSSIINAGQWRMRGTNNTINMASSTLNTSLLFGDHDNSGPYTFNIVNMENGGNIYHDVIINTLILAPRGNFDDYQFESGSTITVGVLQAVGTKQVPIEINSSELGQAAILKKTSGSVDAEYLIMKDIHATGGATFNAYSSMDLGNNDGWAFTDIEASNYYWVGNGGKWSDLTHWSSTSGGNPDYDILPTQFDNVFFDQNSITSPNQNVEIDTTLYLHDLDCSTVMNSPNINAAYDYQLNILGSLDFGENIEGFIFNTSFVGSDDDMTFKQGPNVNMQNISFWGNGTLTLAGPMYKGGLSLFDGTFNTSDYHMTLSRFKQGNFNAPTINLGSSEITISQDFSIQDPDTDLDPGTSHLTVGGDFIGLGFEFYDLTLKGSGNIVGNNTFHDLELAPGASVVFESNSTQTARNEIIAKGSSIEPINLSSSIIGEQATLSLSQGTVEGTYLVLSDMKATGGATFNAIESVDNGNNTGWNITVPFPEQYYWVGGTGDWTDYENHWAKESGGSEFHISPPTILDNIFFDANSFTEGGQSVNVNADEVSFHNMTWEGAQFDPSFNASNVQLNIYGTIHFIASMDFNAKFLNFFSDNIEDIRFDDPRYPGSNAEMKFNGGGTWNIKDSLTTRLFILESGTVKTEGNGVHVDFATYFSGENEKVLDLGTSVWNTRSMSWNSTTGGNLSLLGGQSEIIVTSTFSPTVQISNDDNIIQLNNLRLSSERPDLASINSSIILNKLTIDPGKEVKIFAIVEVQIEELDAEGNQERFIKIFSSQEGDQAAIKKLNGTVDAEFLKLKDIKAIGGATFNAFNSINEGNVSGWTFFKIDQVIDFSELADRTLDSDPITLEASASSDLPVSFSIISGPATIEDHTLYLNDDAGEVSVKAEQEGDINYNPAPSVVRTFCVNPLKPTISENDGILSSSSSEGNQWYKDGQVIEGATDQNLQNLGNGEYNVQVTLNGCTSEISEAFNFMLSSIETVEAQDPILIFPNPATSLINIHSEDGKIEELKIMDSQGKIIRSKKHTSNKIRINVNDFEAGFYYILVKSGEVKHYEKIIVL